MKSRPVSGRIWVLVLLVLVFLGGLMGCGGGDDDDSPPPTDPANPAVPSAGEETVPPAGDEAVPPADQGGAEDGLSEEEAALVRTGGLIAGNWSGAYIYGFKNIPVSMKIVYLGFIDLAIQVTFSNGYQGHTSGSVRPDNRVIFNAREKLTSNPDTWRSYHFDGTVNADGTLYSGSWRDEIGRSGTFSLHR